MNDLAKLTTHCLIILQELFWFWAVVPADKDLMLKKTRKKMGIALILFVAALMLMRLAYATAAHGWSVLLIGTGVLLMLASLVIFGLYFKE